MTDLSAFRNFLTFYAIFMILDTESTVLEQLDQANIFHLYVVLQSLWTWKLFQFLNLYTVGRPPWTADQPPVRLLPTHRVTQTQNKLT
jgi:hypothetical protein